MLAPLRFIHKFLSFKIVADEEFAASHFPTILSSHFCHNQVEILPPPNQGCQPGTVLRTSQTNAGLLLVEIFAEDRYASLTLIEKVL